MAKKQLQLPASEPPETYSVDRTKHIMTKHPDRPPIVHNNPRWYEAWGNKCPMCGATAVHVMEEL